MNYQGSQALAANRFLTRVYAWMTVGLLISAGAAYYAAWSPRIQSWLATSWGFGIVVFAPLMLVMIFSLFLQRLSFASALIIYSLYALLLGVSLSVVILLYTPGSIGLTFAVTAGMFAVMAIYGYTTRADLSSMSSLLLMGLAGVILAGIVNIFLKSERIDFILSVVSVVLFTALTAYDVQRLKNLGKESNDDRLVLYGALTLYLNVVNLFLSLLNILGKRRDAD